jgi:hypothetical protein
MYKQIKDIDGTLRNQIQRLSDMAIIPFDTANIDYKEYLEWVAEGNEPEAAE